MNITTTNKFTWTALPEVIGLLKRALLSLIVLLGETELAPTSLLDRTLLSLMTELEEQNYNPGHNILALFNNLAYVWITTSKTKVASPVAERLKT